jgi:hypothetical protein
MEGNKMRKLIPCAMSFMLMFAAPVMAQTVDESAISELLHTTFDRPEAPLTIAPIVVGGNYAIAGWTQGDMGGRALLRRKEQNWILILCAGDGIKSRGGLVQAGIPIQDAVALERDLAAAEAKLPPQQRSMLSRFEGVMMMESDGSHPPVRNDAHPKH